MSFGSIQVASAPTLRGFWLLFLQSCGKVFRWRLDYFLRYLADILPNSLFVIRKASVVFRKVSGFASFLTRPLWRRRAPRAMTMLSITLSIPKLLPMMVGATFGRGGSFDLGKSFALVFPLTFEELVWLCCRVLEWLFCFSRKWPSPISALFEVACFETLGTLCGIFSTLEFEPMLALVNELRILQNLFNAVRFEKL